MARKTVDSTTLSLIIDDQTFDVVLPAALAEKVTSGDQDALNLVLGEVRRQRTSSSTQHEEKTEEISPSTSEAEDESPARGTTYNFWSREATLYLISLYEEYEEQMEDVTRKKKDTWHIMTKKMNEAGYLFTQNKVESKWKSLMKSHKKIVDNKHQTGGKRKSFHYFQEMSNILNKRHDINPPILAGSGIVKKKQKFTTKAVSAPSTDMVKTLEPCSTCTTTRAQPIEEDSSVPIEVLDDGEDGEIFPGTSSSTTKSAIKRRKFRVKSNPAIETLNFLKGVEEQRKIENMQRETNRERRSEERNKILRDFLDIMKPHSTD